jgi:hypothetical protein
MPTTVDTAEKDEKVLARIIRQQKKIGKEVKDYNFNKEQVEAFRYRMNDALRAVTKVAVREARTRELRQELLKSEKLKRYVAYPSLFKWKYSDSCTVISRKTQQSCITYDTTESCEQQGLSPI